MHLGRETAGRILGEENRIAMFPGSARCGFDAHIGRDPAQHDLGDAAPTQLAFEGLFLPTAAIGPQGPVSTFPAADNPHALLTAYTGDLSLGNGRPQSIYTLDKTRLSQVQVDGAPLAKALQVGQTMSLPGDAGSITFDGVQQFANFQLAHDPGRQLSLLAAVLLLLGLIISLMAIPINDCMRIAAATCLYMDGSTTRRAGPPCDSTVICHHVHHHHVRPPCIHDAMLVCRGHAWLKVTARRQPRQVMRSTYTAACDML